jgi:hypothetical protein
MKWILLIILFLTSCGETAKKGKFAPEPQSDMGVEDASMSEDAAQEDAAFVDAAFVDGSFDDTSFEDMAIEGSPCAVLKSSEVDFETVVVGNSATQVVQIENCSETVPLTINAIATAPISLLAPNSIEPGQVGEVQIVFSPTVSGQFAAQVPIQTSAGALVVSATGFGVNPDNLCPTARIAAGIAPGLSAVSPLNVSTGSLVTFSGLSSTAQQGTIATYSWALVNKPAGSAAMFSGPNTQSQVDLSTQAAGLYVVELTVNDSFGLASCVPARVNVQVSAPTATRFRVTLTWDTPADANQTDTVGTDLDIHYLHPSGIWNQAPYDIFWRNTAATWAANSLPKLTIDDVDGAGPEVIEHDAPMDPLTYAVGAYYYADKGLGVSNAIVSVYVDGVLEFQTSPQALAQEEMFWRPVTINGATGLVTATGLAPSAGFP